MPSQIQYYPFCQDSQSAEHIVVINPYSTIILLQVTNQCLCSTLLSRDTCFQQSDILTRVDSDEPMQPRVKLGKFKCSSVSSNIQATSEGSDQTALRARCEPLLVAQTILVENSCCGSCFLLIVNIQHGSCIVVPVDYCYNDYKNTQQMLFRYISSSLSRIEGSGKLVQLCIRARAFVA